MYTKPLKNTGLNVKAGKNERSIRTRIETTEISMTLSTPPIEVRTKDP